MKVSPDTIKNLENERSWGKEADFILLCVIVLFYQMQQFILIYKIQGICTSEMCKQKDILNLK